MFERLSNAKRVWRTRIQFTFTFAEAAEPDRTGPRPSIPTCTGHSVSVRDRWGPGIRHGAPGLVICLRPLQRGSLYPDHGLGAINLCVCIILIADHSACHSFFLFSLAKRKRSQKKRLVSDDSDDYNAPTADEWATLPTYQKFVVTEGDQDRADDEDREEHVFKMGDV